jgi:iron complex outermembrane receptor protein
VTFVLPTDIADNHIPSRTFVNLQMSYDLGSSGHRRQFFFNVSNLFDRPPPGIFAFVGGPNYDRIGRAFRAGLRFTL